MVTKRTQQLLETDLKHVFHHFGVVGAGIEIIWEKGKGVMLWDTEGKEYIDVCSSQSDCVNLGYGRKEIIDAAMEQMNKIAYASTMPPFSNVAMIECAEKLVKITPESINHFFFCSGGSEAVETGYKIAKKYWNFVGQANKYKIICLANCYHGSLLFTGSLTWEWPMREKLGPEFPFIVRIPSYICYRCSFGLNYPDCGVRCAKFLETAIEQEGEFSVAAFIAEPEQGVGGYVSPPPEYFPMVAKICKDHNVLLIIDEVMSGFCRTGKMLAVEHWNLKPNILLMSKGINSAYVPFGAVGVSNEVYKPFLGNMFLHGMTQSGNPVGCATSSAAIDVYLKEKVAENAAKVGWHVKQRFQKEFLPLPHVGDVGGLGLMLSLEIVADKATKARCGPEKMIGIRRRLLDKGIYARVTSSIYGDRLHFGPPCIITQAEADRAVDLIYSVLKDIK